MPFHNYRQINQIQKNHQKLEKCNICGGIEKAGYSYCRIRNFWRKTLLFSFIFFMGALFCVMLFNFRFPANNEFLTFLIAAAIFSAYFFPGIFISQKIIDWDRKKISDEEEALANNPKQKVYPHYLKRIK